VVAVQLWANGRRGADGKPPLDVANKGIIQTGRNPIVRIDPAGLRQWTITLGLGLGRGGQVTAPHAPSMAGIWLRLSVVDRHRWSKAGNAFDRLGQ
jgi:hypothetical protein